MASPYPTWRIGIADRFTRPPDLLQPLGGLAVPGCRRWSATCGYGFMVIVCRDTQAKYEKKHGSSNSDPEFL